MREARHLAEPMIVVVAGVAFSKGSVMLCRRAADSLEGLKWEFPGGKVERGETPEEALAREWSEELGVTARAGTLLDAIVHPCSLYPDRDILVLYYVVEILQGEPQPIDCSGIAWTLPEGIAEFSLAPADALFVRHMENRWRKVL